MSEIRFNRWSHQSGTGGIYQDSSGNIGIGTSTPTSVLDIQGGSIKIGNDLLTSSGVSTFTSGFNVTGGSVGIGTDNPVSELMIENSTQSHITVKTSRSNMAKFGSKGNDVYIGGTAGAANIIFKRNITSIDHPADSGTETVRINSSGNIGIGTNNPGLPLDVVADSSSETVRFRGYSTGDQTGTLRFTSNDGATIYSSIQSRSTFFRLGSTPDIPVIITANNKEIVRVEDNTVHIGDRSGNNNVTHFGTSRVNICGPQPIATTITKANSYLSIGNNETTLNGVYPITFGYTNNSNDYQPAYIAYKTTNSASAEYGDLIFGTRNVTTDTLPSERLRITSSGQVNISALDGTYRNPSLTNIQRNGLIIFPSSANGTTAYSDNHMFSISQSQGDWLDGVSGNYHSSWGPLWTFHNGSGGYQKRAGIHYDHRSTEQFKFWSSYGDFVFKTDTGRSGNETAETCDTEAMRISYLGHVTKPSQPACKMVIDSSGTIASGSGPADTGRTIVPFNSTAYGGFNTGNHFNTSNHTFTCPVAGRYLVISSVNVIGDNIQYIYINGSPRAAGEFRSNPTGVWEHNEISAVFDLSANDTIAAFSQLMTGSGRKWNGGNGGSYWDTLSIYLVG
jgi:hypothetical protein